MPYVFGAQPRPLSATRPAESAALSVTATRTAERSQRSKYRNDSSTRQNGGQLHDGSFSLMSDPRVFRGSSYSLARTRVNTTFTSSKESSKSTDSLYSVTFTGKQKYFPKHTSQQSAIHHQNALAMTIPRISTPEPVEGRVHVVVQTDTYIEDLRYKPYPEPISTQTDETLDYDTDVLFIPRPSGGDQSTEMEKLWPEGIFDFYLHVEPISIILVEKTIQESLLEVCQECEDARIAIQKQNFSILQETEQKKLNELLDRDERRQNEREKRRIQEEKVQKEKQEIDNRKRNALVSQNLLLEMQTMTAQKNEIEKCRDPVNISVEDLYLPQLKEDILTALIQHAQTQQVLDDLLFRTLEDKPRVIIAKPSIGNNST